MITNIYFSDLAHFIVNQDELYKKYSWKKLIRVADSVIDVYDSIEETAYNRNFVDKFQNKISKKINELKKYITLQFITIGNKS